MSKENNIRKGLLSEKMSKFQVKPPESAWENISSQIHSGRSRRIFFIALAAAAGLALAITVGVNIIEKPQKTDIAENAVLDQTPENSTEIDKDETIQEQEVEAQEVEVQDQESEKETTISPEIRKDSSQPTKLEEKVLIAMEEVIQEIEDEAMERDEQDEVIVAENIEVTQDNDEDVQEKAIVEDQEETDSDDLQVIDTEYSERYLDSIANAVIPDHEIIPDIEKEKKRWQVGASLTPLYSYRDASSSDQVQNMAANDAESGLLAYSGGVQVRYAQSNRLTFESGLYYNKMGLAIGDFDTYRSNMDYVIGNEILTDNSIVSMSNSIGTISTSSADVVLNEWAGSSVESYSSWDSKEMRVQDEVVNSFVQSLGYLEIPFNVKYKVLDRNLKVLLVGGLSTNLLIGNHVLANTDNGKIDYGSVQDIRTVNYSGNAGLGFIYEFPGNISLSLEPRFKYYLNSVNSTYLPVTRPYALGIYTGVNYTF
ncbi:outer membrane beta-barrel protein [Bacteroidota bacterium]